MECLNVSFPKIPTRLFLELVCPVRHKNRTEIPLRTSLLLVIKWHEHRVQRAGLRWNRLVTQGDAQGSFTGAARERHAWQRDWESAHANRTSRGKKWILALKEANLACVLCPLPVFVAVVVVCAGVCCRCCCCCLCWCLLSLYYCSNAFLIRVALHGLCFCLVSSLLLLLLSFMASCLCSVHFITWWLMVFKTSRQSTALENCWLTHI